MLNANDAPTLTDEMDQTMLYMSTALSTSFLPHVPFDITNYEGVTAGTLANSYFVDKDGDDIGIAIFGAQDHATTGWWYSKTYL